MVRIVLFLLTFIFSTAFASSSEIKSVLLSNSKVYGIPYKTLSKIADVESKFNKLAKNGNSSARGLFQITKGLQDSLEKRYKLTGDIFDAKYNTKLAAISLRDGARALRRKKLRRTTLNFYLIHFFGTTQACRFIKADDNKIGRELFPREAKYNPTIFRNRTIGQIKKLFRSKLRKARVL